jgi:hypothetical protein
MIGEEPNAAHAVPPAHIGLSAHACAASGPNVLTNAILPAAANPAATDTMFCSAMRASK